MKPVSPDLVVAYLTAAVMPGLAVWVSSDWHWGIALGGPIQITGLVAGLALAAVYVVAWVAAPLFAPIGYLLLRADPKTKGRTG